MKYTAMKSVTLHFEPSVQQKVCYRQGRFSHTETTNPDGSVTYDFREQQPAFVFPEGTITVTRVTAR